MWSSQEARFQMHLDAVRRDLGTTIEMHEYRLALFGILYGSIEGRSLMQRRIELWVYIMHSLHMTFHTTLGRVMDGSKGVQSFPRLVTLCQELRGIFSQRAFATRVASRLEGSDLTAYIASQHVPSTADFKSISRTFAKLRPYYDEKIKPVRDKLVAHSAPVSQDEAKTLLSGVELDAVDRLIYGLKGLTDDIYELYHNGARPRLVPSSCGNRAEFRNSVTAALLGTN
jgi:hypothetical protein